MLGKLAEFVATAQGKAIAALVVVVLFSSWSLGMYLQGRSDGKQGCLTAMQTVAARVADRRADNAVDATERYRLYTLDDRELEVGIAEALEQVHAYYDQNQSPQKVEVTKLVPVPGQKEYVYVPTDACPNSFLNADELRLYNLGNKRSDFDSSDSK